MFFGVYPRSLSVFRQCGDSRGSLPDPSCSHVATTFASTKSRATVSSRCEFYTLATVCHRASKAGRCSTSRLLRDDSPGPRHEQGCKTSNFEHRFGLRQPGPCSQFLRNRCDPAMPDMLWASELDRSAPQGPVSPPQGEEMPNCLFLFSFLVARCVVADRRRIKTRSLSSQWPSSVRTAEKRPTAFCGTSPGPTRQRHRAQQPRQDCPAPKSK